MGVVAAGIAEETHDVVSDMLEKVIKEHKK
jgi:hypothetical protein